MTDKRPRGLALMNIYHHTAADVEAILFDNGGMQESDFMIFRHRVFLVIYHKSLPWFCSHVYFVPVFMMFLLINAGL